MQRVLCLVAVASIASTAVGAAQPDYRQFPAQREGRGWRPPHADKPLLFRAPPSQLLEAWRCTLNDPYVPPFAARPCQYDPRMTPDFLMDPYVAQRLMPPMRTMPPASAPAVPAPEGATLAPVHQ